jgi:hypothetical protein
MIYHRGGVKVVSSRALGLWESLDTYSMNDTSGHVLRSPKESGEPNGGISWPGQLCRFVLIEAAVSDSHHQVQ